MEVGVESDNIFLHENFSYIITDPTQFDDGTPPTFSFLASRPDLEQSAFVQDLIRLGNWTINAGLRWDHYQLLLNRQAVDPRLAISRYFPSAGLVLHFSYDRVFQTPSFENILLSSSTAATSLRPDFPSSCRSSLREGNYYEAGLTKAFFKKFRLDANYFRRLVNNYADDDQIDNTTISFPIAFRKAIIYGAEGKIDLPDWHRFSGFCELFLYRRQCLVPGDRRPISGRRRGAYPAHRPLSRFAGSAQHRPRTAPLSGRAALLDRGRNSISTPVFPLNSTATLPTVLAEYGQQVLNRINFASGRIYPSFQVNASAGADVYKSDRMKMQLQIDGQNLNNVLDVIDFGGLFSGNAIGPSRSFALRLTTTF